MVVQPEDIHAAFERIGRTPDGKLMRLYFVEMLLSGPGADLSEGAVFREVGRMTLAREILTLLDASPDVAGQSTVVILRKPVVGTEHRGAVRRVRPSGGAGTA